MSQILIADAGSTKTEWVIIDSSGILVARATGGGINISVSSEEDAFQKISDAHRELEERADTLLSPDEIYYYGAGCSDNEKCEKIKSALLRSWKDAGHIEVASDMLGVARALFGSTSGMGCILGTGSNSCLYDGEKITANIPPLGYILGDEGSGAVIGKRFISDLFKGLLDEEITEKFKAKFGLDVSEVINSVYRKPEANRFLASFVPFIAENITCREIERLVSDEICRFFERDILPYQASKDTPVGLVGGVALAFEKIIRKVTDEYGYNVCTIIPVPMPGLIMFHSSIS